MHSSASNYSAQKGSFLRMKILDISPDICLGGLQSWPSVSGKNLHCVKDFHIQSQKQFASSQS